MKNNAIIYFILLVFCSVNTYSQTSSIKELLNRYSLNPLLVESWKADSNGCRQHLRSIDTIKSIIGMKMADFFVLLGKPDLLTNEYGEQSAIKDTIICTYQCFGNCKIPKDKNVSVGEVYILFINGELKNISSAVID